MTWKEWKLNELGHVSRGRSRHRPRDAAHLYGGPHPFFQTGDIKAAQLYLTEYSQTYSEAGLEQSKKWPAGTLCITIAANIAETAILGIDACFPDSVIGFIADEAKCDVRFIKYKLDIVKRTFQQVSHGAAQDNLSQEKLLSFPLLIPEPTTQRRIAEVLSAYDDLIENNRRRMALLEESARLLYQEWFVRLRFPGHEHVGVVKGVPQGWERLTLGDCLTLKRGHDLPEANRVPGTIPIVSSSGITGFHNVKKANGPGLVTGRYGTLGEVYYVDEDYWPHNTALYVCDFKGHSARVLYFFLKHALQDARSNNAAVPGLNRNVLHTLPVLWPPVNLRDDFDDFLEPLFHQLATLRRFNEKLTAARDLLLPRLMSGEITA